MVRCLGAHGTPIGPGAGAVWLLAAALVLLCAGLVAAGTPTWWWVVAIIGAVVSQVAIATSWNDARAGTTVNVVLVVAAVYGFASVGPASFHRPVDHQVEPGPGRD